MGYTDLEKAAAYAREWRAKNLERAREIDRERRDRERLVDPSKATRKVREWRAANPEKQQVHVERQNAKQKELRRTDPEYKECERKRRAKHMAKPGVREKHQELWRVRSKEDRAKFPEKHRAASLLKLYGLTLEQYDVMVLAQEGKCAICQTVSRGNSRQKHWHVDHCHDSGRVRGLLCHACNTGLGSFKDDLELLRAAIAYLEKHREAL